MDPQVAVQGGDWVSAVTPLLKLLCLTVIGLLLAHPRAQVVPKATFKLLSKLVFALFLPCLIFVHLGQSVTLHNVLHWWFIPVNVLIATAVGCALGYAVALVCRPPPRFFRFTVIMTGFGNTGNLPIAIIGSVCHTADHPFGPGCHREGIAYVSFAQWVAVLLVYTLVYHMMEPPMQYYEIVGEGNEIERVPEEEPQVSNFSRPLLQEAEWPGMADKETEHSKTLSCPRDGGTTNWRDTVDYHDLRERLGEKSEKEMRNREREVREFRLHSFSTYPRSVQGSGF